MTDWPVGQRVMVDPGLNLIENENSRRGEESISPGYGSGAAKAELILYSDYRNLSVIIDSYSADYSAVGNFQVPVHLAYP
jgi:hypothetical protein